VLVFESASQLTAYDNDGHQQVYRYDATADELACLSCVGPGPATGHATLQNRYAKEVDPINALTGLHAVRNVTPDGETVVFQSEDPLVPEDGNGKQDVYRWHDGELALITTGQSRQDSMLYAIDDDASDIVVLTAQKLTPADANGGTAALYDVRVGGGFPAATASGPEPCIDDACQGPAAPPPPVSTPASSGVRSGGTPAQPRSCARQRTGVRQAKLRRTRVLLLTRGAPHRPASRRARQVASKRLRRAKAQLQQCRRSVR
jgi:hypothetical protein